MTDHHVSKVRKSEFETLLQIYSSNKPNKHKYQKETSCLQFIFLLQDLHRSENTASEPIAHDTNEQLAEGGVSPSTGMTNQGV